MKKICKIFTFLLLTAALSELGGCGKMSNPEPIEGSGYAHEYPRR